MKSEYQKSREELVIFQFPTMAEAFAKAVDDGLKLAKRVNLGRDSAATAPKPPGSMERSAASSTPAYLPTAPMVYAVIPDPGIVDNPDFPSYQPHVHGRCDPPALVPLQMNAIELEVDCYLDMALVRVTGSWRVHCVMGSRTCDCQIAVPMGEQGAILGVEVEVSRKSYSTRLITVEDRKEVEKAARPEDGGFLKPNIFTLKIPQIDGGATLSMKILWSQKLLCNDGQFSVNVPFHFPEYVTPAVKKISKKENIQLSINAGTGTEVLCKTSSHPLKEIRRHVGRIGFSYEAEVLKWSNTDFNFSYAVSSSQIFGGLSFQSPSVDDADQREIFSVYLIPGSERKQKVFRKEVIFVIDTSGSMGGQPLECLKSTISAALSKLDVEDAFNIIAFNDDTYLFSTSMKLATSEAVERGIEWMSKNFVAGGGTNMLSPLEKAVEMLSNTRGSVPMIFFVTDGAIQDERHICNVIKKRFASSEPLSPRIYPFGIGFFCNHYFLQTLASVSRGKYDSAYDTDCIEGRMERLIMNAFSTILVNISVDCSLDEFEVPLIPNVVYPSHIPDLSSAGPLILSGRCKGNMPGNIKAKGLLGDLSSFVVDLKLQSVKDTPLDKLIAKQQIDLLTAEAWFTESQQLEEKVAKMSIQTGISSEFTRMILLENTEASTSSEFSGKKKVVNEGEKQKMVSRTIPIQSLGIGFGNTTATAENTPPGFKEAKLPDAAEKFVKAASGCCMSMCNKCCCMCFIQCCSKLNDQFVIVVTQLCVALACIGCFECCSICCCEGDGN